MTIELAERLQRLRKEHGYTQDSLADALGVSRQAVSKWECTEASPDTDNLIALARLYGITLDELVNGKDGQTEANEERERPSDADGAAGENAEGEGEKADGFGIHIEKDGKEVHIGGGGYVHISEGDGAEVHIGSDGIHIVDGDGDTVFTGDKMEADESGVHISDEDGTEVHIDGTHVCVNGKDCGKEHFKTGKIIGAVSGITTIACTVAYILLGALGGWWHPAWIVFLAIPVIPSLVEGILKRNADKFAFPVFVTAVYLVLGCLGFGWHPWWVVFLTIPVYYAVVKLIKQLRK